MGKVNVRNVYKKILAILFVPFILSGCKKESNCDITEEHIADYTDKKKNK